MVNQNDETNQVEKTTKDWNKLIASVVDKESPRGCVATSSYAATSTYT